MFIISAEVYVFGLVMYLILASGKEQDWANGWPPRHTSDSSSVEKLSSVKRSVQIVTPPLAEQTKLTQQPPTDVDYGSV